MQSFLFIHVFYTFSPLFWRQMPWRDLTLELLCGERYLGLRFSEEAEAFWLTLDMTFQLEMPPEKELGLIHLYDPCTHHHSTGHKVDTQKVY